MLERLFGKKTIPKVCLMGMNERMLNMLTMFLNDSSKDWCEIVSDGSHEIVIIDMDSMDSSRVWMDLRRNFHGPAIVLSVGKRDLVNAYWVAKPLKPEQFKQALEQAKRYILESGNQPKTAPSHQPLPRPQGATTQAVESKAPLGAGAATGMSEQMDERSQACCGDMADEVYLDPRQRDKLYSDWAHSLLRFVHEAMRMTAKGGVVSFQGLAGKPLYVSAAENFVSTPIPEAIFRSLCVRSEDSRAITLVLEDKTPAEIGPSEDQRMRRLDNLLWKVALWSSRGRLQQGLSVDAPVRLRAWPNIPRLMTVPHSLRIAALWARQPTSLMDTARKLGVPHRYVFSFFCACNAFDLVEQLGEHASPRVTQSATKAITQEKRSLFGSLLKKLGF